MFYRKLVIKERVGPITTYEACLEIIETLAFYPEHIDLDKQNSA